MTLSDISGNLIKCIQANCTVGFELINSNQSLLFENSVGYDSAAKIIKTHKEGTTLKSAAILLNLITEEEFGKVRE